MRHIRLILQFDGTDYSGWQVQRHRAQKTEDRTQKKIITIQETLQDAIESVTGRREKVIGASRTDAGVHAIEQVASFRTHTNLETDVINRALNANLPRDVRVIDVTECAEDFHPRYSAKSKTYSYIISHSGFYSVFLKRYSWQVPYDLLPGVKAMREALKYIIGEHDFSSFRASGCSSKNPIRNVFNVKISEYPSFDFMTFKLNVPVIKIKIEANAFLRHMVRNIVGTLVDIGRGKKPPTYMKEALVLRDRRVAGATAPACGLFLEKIIY